MNDEMAMEQGGGTKGKPVVERMLNVFDLHFSTPAEKAMSRICASKTERNLQIFGWCLQFKQSCPWATLSYFCLQNKAGKINAIRRVVLRKMFQKSSALSIHFEMRRSPFANWIHYICRQKTTTSLWNLDQKGNWRKRNVWPQAYNAQYTAQWRGVWEESGGRGGSFTQPIHKPGAM